MFRLAAYSPHTLGLLRIIAALLFMQHGLQKMFHFPDAGYHPEPFELFTLIGIGGVLEVFGGALLAIGLLTRATAFVLSGEMAVAYFLYHWLPAMEVERGFFPVVNKGDLAILFCFVFLHFFCAGPGSFAVDNALSSRRTVKD